MMIYTPQPCFFDVTDPGWFKFHHGRQSIEVNFWRPSAMTFKALEPGQNILFKLKKPYHHIAGGGTFVRYERTRLSEAWRLYGEMNGFSSYAEMKRKLAKSNDPDPIIGCKILEACFFYDQSDWRPCPDSFATNIVSGRTYGIHEVDGQELNAEFEARRSDYLLQRARDTSEQYLSKALIDWDDARAKPQFGKPYLTKPRLGQGGFRSLVLDAYGKQCAVTREHTEPVLEAAHIRPYSQGGEHSLGNALLLRSDFHTLFDLGYVTITPDYKFEVSDSIREHFNNGVRYETRRGSLVAVPDEVSLRPNPKYLEWHNESVFMG